jgi:hypothetical protein
MKWFEALSAWWSPEKAKLLDVGLWAGAIGVLAATLRIVAQRMPLPIAAQTIAMSTLIGVIVGISIEPIEAVSSFKNMIVAISAIAAKEWVEFLLRAVGRVRDR